MKKLSKMLKKIQKSKKKISKKFKNLKTMIFFANIYLFFQLFNIRRRQFDQSSPVHPVSDFRGGSTSLTYGRTDEQTKEILVFNFMIALPQFSSRVVVVLECPATELQYSALHWHSSVIQCIAMAQFISTVHCTATVQQYSAVHCHSALVQCTTLPQCISIVHCSATVQCYIALH